MSEFGSPTPAEPRQESVPGPTSTDDAKRKKLEAANARIRRMRADIAKKRAAKAQEEDAERLADLRELQKLSGFKDKKTPKQIRNEQIDEVLEEEERTADLRQLAQSSVAAREKAAAAKAAEEDREWNRKIAETRTRIAQEEAAAVPSGSAEDEEWVKTLKQEIARGAEINEEAAKAKESVGQKIAKREQKKIASAESDPYLKEEVKKLNKLQAEQKEISDRLESLTGMTADEAYENLVLKSGFMGRIKRGLASMANIPTYKLLDEWLALSRKTEESQRLIDGVKPDLLQQRRGRYQRAKAEGPSEEMLVKRALEREAAREYAEEHGPLTEESLGLDQVNVQEQQSSEALPEMLSEEDQEIERIAADYKEGIVRDADGEVITDERAIRRPRPAGLVNYGGRAGTSTSFGEVGGRRGLTTRGSEQAPAVTEEEWQAQLEANRQAYEASQREIASQKRITEEEKPSTPELTKQELLAIQRFDQMFKDMQGLQAEIEAATDEQALESQNSFNERMALFDKEIEALIEKNNNSTSEELFESAKRADEELKKLKDAYQKKYAALQQSARSAGKGQRRTGITLSSGRTSGGRSFGASAMDRRATISTRPEQPSVTEADWQTELAKNQQEYEASKQEDRLAYQRQNANEIASIRTEYPQAAEEWNKINTKLQELDQEDRDELSSIFGTSDIATAYTLNLARKDLKGDKNAESLIDKANTLLGINKPNQKIVIDPEYLKEVRNRNRATRGKQGNKAA